MEATSHTVASRDVFYLLWGGFLIFSVFWQISCRWTPAHLLSVRLLTPLCFCFLFGGGRALRTSGRGPTYREIKNAPPWVEAAKVCPPRYTDQLDGALPTEISRLRGSTRRYSAAAKVILALHECYRCLLRGGCDTVDLDILTTAAHSHGK